MSRQLTFDLTAIPAFGRADFFVSQANTLAAGMVSNPDGWPNGKLVLTGPAGSGKSHLARVWADQSGAVVLHGPALGTTDPGALLREAVVVDDADQVAGQPDLERPLLHLHNLVLAEGGRLLLTAQTPPSQWPVRLPDLASRMQASATVALEPPDDALLSAVLIKLFADRQVHVSPQLVQFLARRMERSLFAASRLVGALDALALASNRPISRALAAEVLDSAAQNTA